MEFIKSSIKTQKKYLLAFWILGLILTMISLSIPLIEAKMLDVLVYTQNINDFKHWIGILILMLPVQVIIRYFISKIDSICTSKFALDFNQKIIGLLFKSNTRDVLEFEPTYLHSRILQDTESLIQFKFSTISSIINNLAVMIYASIVLFKVNYYILLSLIIFMPVYTVIYVLFKGKIKTATLEQSEASNSCFSARNNIYNNYLEIKTREREKSAKSILKLKEHTLLKSIGKMFRLRFNLSTTQLTVSSIFQFGGFILGGLAVMNGHITLGVFTYLLQYFSMLLDTVEQFLSIGTSYQEYKVSIERLNHVLDLEKVPDGEIELENISSIELVDLNYSYGAETNLYEKDINIRFEKGNIYNIVGKNGTGKTTVLLLLLGVLRDNDLKGEILFNGIESEKLNMSLLRSRNVSTMIQKGISFDGTVKEYISSILLETEISYATNDPVYLDVFVNQQFDLNKILDKEYNIISGGERQLLNLFVCLAKKVSVYLLDEPTSNIFPGAKERILFLLNKKADEGSIVIIITHDNDMIKNSKLYTLG